jgi:kynurenine formamidase
MRTLAGIVGTVLLGSLTIGLAAQQAAAPSRVSQAQLDKWKTEFSNWGRWGKEDEKGTINLITPEKRKQAAALIKEGFNVSLARDADTVKSIENTSPYENAMVSVSSNASTDRISIAFHGLSNTHLDGLAHHFIGGKMYNGFSRDQYVTMQGGATKAAIINVKGGVFTRGVLMDIPRLKGVPFLEPGTRIYPEDLEAWEKQAGLKIGSGDAVFIRTGRWVRRAQTGPWDIGKLDAGLDPSVLPWIKSRDISLLGTESAVDAIPIPREITDPDDYRPVHNFLLVILGTNLFDNCDLTAVSEAAAARKRWDFALTASPLPMQKGTGSPINPIAIF